jgi:outer membrane biogenesis lipoprotein LolB
MTKKKPFQLEFIVKSSATILWDFIYNPSGLANWFADHVDSHHNVYSFTWNGSTDTAELIAHKDMDYARFRWSYQAKDEYFEMKISISEISRDTILTVTDFADAKEIKDQSMLWESQIKSLKQHIGGQG